MAFNTANALHWGEIEVSALASNSNDLPRKQARLAHQEGMAKA